MPSVYDLKPKFQNLLRPASDFLAAKGVSANNVTTAAMLLSVAVGVLLFTGATRLFWLVPLTMLVRMALNAIDGMLAREHAMKSNLGAILNELSDVVSDIALYLPFAFIADFPQLLTIVVIFLAVISEMAGVIAVQIGADRRYDGPMGKSDRAVVFSVLAMLVACDVKWSTLYFIVIAAVAILLCVTIKNRCANALKNTEGA
ncbi:CDP-alcohol phosphatidyltransferase family protein [Oligoflexaceae bacterium]|nr:CDP-alcohol phosphatidyltransferase family protein [Oligoflexaceae bacterium]